MEALLKKALSLNPDDRARLAKELLNSLQAGKVSIEDRAVQMYAALQAVDGRPMEPAMRDNFNAWARAIVAYSLAAEGYSENAIGTLMRRDHSTVNHMKQNMASALSRPNMYPDVIRRYNSFRNNLELA